MSEASDLLKLLANPNRLAIVCHLMEQQCSVTTLEADLGIRQPTLSQQLTELREAGVIAGQRDGKNILYRVDDPRVATLVRAMRTLFSGLDDVTGRRMKTVPVDELMFD